MSNGATMAFTPRTVSAIERGSAALVSRYASPVRSIGERTIGFADRILGARVFTDQGGRASRAASRGGALAGLPITAPWYELEPRGGVAAARGVSAWSPQVASTRPREAAPAVRPQASRQALEAVTQSLPGASAAATELPVSDSRAPDAHFPSEVGMPVTGASSAIDTQRAPAPEPVSRRTATAPTVTSASRRPESSAPAAIGVPRPADTEQLPQTVTWASDTPLTVAFDAARPADTQRPATLPQAVAPIPASPSGDTGVPAGSQPERAHELVRVIGQRPDAFAPAALPAALLPQVPSVVAPIAPTALGRPIGHGAWVDAWLTRLSGDPAASARAREIPAVALPVVHLPAAEPHEAEVRPRPHRSASQAAAPQPAGNASVSALPGTDVGSAAVPPRGPGMPPALVGVDDRAPSLATTPSVVPPASGASRATRMTSSSPVVEAGFGLASPAVAAGIPSLGFGASLWDSTALPGLVGAGVPNPDDPLLAGAPMVGPAAGALGALRFIERLVGTQSARDARALPIHEGVTLAFVARAAMSPPAQAPAMPSSPQGPAGLPPAHLLAAAASAQGTPASAVPSASPPSASPPVPIQPAHPAASNPSGRWLRPGGIGARSEMAASRIGLRAASMSLDFVDPQHVPSLFEARGAIERTLVSMPMAAATGGAPRASMGTADGAQPPNMSASARVTSGAPAVAPEGSHLVGALPAQLAAEVRTGGPQALHAAQTLLARQAHDAWALANLFPSSVPPASEALAWQAVFPMLSLAAAPPGPARTSTGAPTQSAAAVGTESPAVSRAAADAPARTSISPPNPVGSPGARPALPDGRLPRGSFTWPRAATFVSQLGEWMVPLNAVAASAGAESAAAGRPVWDGMPALVTPALQESLGAAEESGTSAPGSMAALREVPKLTMLRGGAQPGRGGIPASRALAGGGAARPEALTGVDTSEQGSLTLSSREAVTPLLRALVAGASPAAAAADSARGFSSSSASAPPVMPAAPASDASAKMVEALRSQQASSNDDRITLGDLTLVAVASATQQMAASGHGPSGAAPRHHGGNRGSKDTREEQDPETERYVIEDLARAVIEEIKQQFRVAHERSGRTWES